MNFPPIWTATRPPFTFSQWQELEHQALIFKYLKAGMTVPSELLAPIRKSLGLMSPKFVNQQALGYCSYYGKKIDPEPGRCRRTDGKKWRCSRDAHPDSKYCERHMIRRRYRSRKHVESQAHVQSQAHVESQAVESQAAPQSSVGSDVVVAAGSRSDSGSLPSLPLHTNGSREGLNLGNYVSQLQIEPLPSEIKKKEYRFGLNSEADEPNFLQKALGLANVRYHGFDSSSNGTWSQLSQIPSNPVSESMNDSIMVNNFFRLRAMHNNEPLNLATASRSKEQEVFGGQFSSAGCLRQESETRQSFFSDWHWKRDLSSAFMEYRPSKDSNCIPNANINCSGSL